MVWFRTKNMILFFFLLLISGSSSVSNSLFTYTGDLMVTLVINQPQMENKNFYDPQEDPESKLLYKILQLWNNSYLEEVLNVSFFGNVFDGYNLFVLRLRKPADPNFRQRVLFITDMNGEIFIEKTFNDSEIGASQSQNVEFINSTTVIMGESDGLALWNVYNDQTMIFNFYGHHEYEYNHANNTFLTLQVYIKEINEVKYVYDRIEEYDMSSQLVWSLDTDSFISHTQWCPFKDLNRGLRDITHTNSIFSDPEEDVLYCNMRNVNTFYKIDHKTGKVLWGLGEYGNFTLFDRYGRERTNLFYHAHAVEKVGDHTFILFDNDLHNQTNPEHRRSQILELTINETTMTANETWSWSAPAEYYSPYWGDADRLPNGNRLGTFGVIRRPGIIGVRLVEVNNEGDIVWEMDFNNSEEFVYGVYRMERFRLTPILSAPPDLHVRSNDPVNLIWQTWYNFRTRYTMSGSYTLYLDGKPIESGAHTFDEYWRPTDLTITLDWLSTGTHNLTLVLMDEGNHSTHDTVLVFVDPEPSSTPPEPSSSTATQASFSVLGFLWGVCVVLNWRILRKRLRNQIDQ